MQGYHKFSRETAAMCRDTTVSLGRLQRYVRIPHSLQGDCSYMQLCHRFSRVTQLYVGIPQSLQGDCRYRQDYDILSRETAATCLNTIDSLGRLQLYVGVQLSLQRYLPTCICRDTIGSLERLQLYRVILQCIQGYCSYVQGYHRISRETAAVCKDIIESLGRLQLYVRIPQNLSGDIAICRDTIDSLGRLSSRQ